jgi:hypothetical protein
MPRKPPFSVPEHLSFREWTKDRQELFSRKVSELELKGSRLEELVQQLYREMEEKGISFRPPVYLTDEWGCPDGVPVIGIPFYLADERLAQLEDELMEGIEGETEVEILRFLRHEAGHAFNYAYRLYQTEEWHQLFGPYSRPYLEEYTPDPFSRDYVRYLAGWYAQKHPDEDFAETFAVWLTPGSHWRELYRDWGCYRKLLYVDGVVAELGRTAPVVAIPEYKETLAYSVGDHYKLRFPEPVQLPNYFDGDLRDIFRARPEADPGEEWLRAEDFLKSNRRWIIRKVNYWTGLSDVHVRALVNHFADRCKVLDLWLRKGERNSALIEITVYVTALSMNRLLKGDFVAK